MIDHSLKLLGLGLVVAMAAGCPADDTEETGGNETESAPTTGTPTSGSPTTNQPSTTDPATTDSPTTMVDPDTGETDPTGDTEDPTGEPGACAGVPDSGAAAGEACGSNGECESGVCLLFQDVPADDDAVCGETMDDCSTRMTGSVFALGDPATPVSDVDVNIVAALDAITNPAGATPIASGTSGADGTVDFASDGPISAAIAIIAVAGGEGTPYFLTAAGVASPDDSGAYEVGVGLHEYHLVPSADLDTWNAALEGQADDAQLPVGPAGGIVGFVRGPDGAAIAGATVSPVDDGSAATIYYPQADGSVTTDMTGDAGIFIALGGMSTGEDYQADADGMTGTARAGTAANVVFSMVLSVQ